MKQVYGLMILFILWAGICFASFDFGFDIGLSQDNITSPYEILYDSESEVLQDSASETLYVRR